MTFERDAFGEHADWQDVYRWLNYLLEPLRLGVGQQQLAPDGASWLLDAHIAQAQLILHLVESQLEWRDYQDAVGFDWTGAIDDLLRPWLPIGRIRQIHHTNLRVYAELLRVYLELLDEIRHGTDADRPPASKLETYDLG